MNLKLKQIKQYLTLSNVFKKGDALILTLFIMAGMLVVAMSGSYIVLLGIKAAGTQFQSGKAYYAAETGAERILWELRKNGFHYTVVSKTTPILSGSLGGSPSDNYGYEVYLTKFPPLNFQSIGNFRNSKRSVELVIGNSG